MSYRVEITRRAARGLAALPANIREDLTGRIAALAAEPRPQNVGRLHGEFTGLLKLRVGDYRVVYEVDDAHDVVAVLRAGHRHNVYR